MAVHYGCRTELEEYLCCGVDTPPHNMLLHYDDKCIRRPTRVGKGTDGGHILICGRKKSFFPFHCMVGPDWPIVVVVFTMIISVNVIVLPIISALGWPVLLIGLVGFISLLASYASVACSDPGIVYDPDSAKDIIAEQNGHENADIESRGLVSSTIHGDDQGGVLSTSVQDGDALSPLSPSSSALNPQPNVSDAQSYRHAQIMPENNTSSISSSSAVVTPLVVQNLVHSESMDCGQCEIKRPRTARHCTYCGVCVEQLGTILLV